LINKKQQMEQTIKHYMESQEYQQKRDKIIAEINADKISIDRSIFKKSKDEKLLAKEAKKDWKKSQRELDVE